MQYVPHSSSDCLIVVDTTHDAKIKYDKFTVTDTYQMNNTIKLK